MNGTERKSKRQRNGESKLAQKKHRLHRKESKYKTGGTMTWKIPYYAESTAAVIRHNWLLKVLIKP